MSLSEAMLAVGIVEYLEKNHDDFAQYLHDLYDVEVDVSFGRDSQDDKRMLMTLSRTSSSMEALSERDYYLRIEKP